MLLAVVAVGVIFLPETIYTHTARVLPHATRAALGMAALTDIQRLTGAACATPKGTAVVRMQIDAGSLDEGDNERGYAHYVEHMAFNGSTNVPEGEMVRKLERLGLSFGADTNASTGYLRTQYKLDLPKSDPQLIDQALFLLRETASEVLFNPEAVERERGVVIAEMRDRENYGFQRNRAASELLYPDSYFSARYPIGKLDVLQTASAEKMSLDTLIASHLMHPAHPAGQS